MQDLTGKKFGKLTVLKFAYKRGYHEFYTCECECGKIKDVRKDHLKSGQVVSCGCFRKTNLGNLNRTHGKTETTLYSKYEGMKRRCYNPKDERFKHYGERGITVCQEWLDNFMNFYNWAIQNGYKKNLSIDRIDVNGNYCPDNCRWVNHKTQACNRRTNLKLTYNNQTLCIKEWAEKYNIKYTTLLHRIKRNWSIERALNTP